MATKATSILTGGTNNHLTTSEEANAMATDFITPGCVGVLSSTAGSAPMAGSYAVNAQGTPNMTVAVSAGRVYISTTPSGQGAQTIRTYMNSAENVTIAANSSGSTKYDWLYIANDTAAAANPATDGTNVSTFFVSRSTSTSVDNGTPPTSSQPLSVITVANGASSITNAMIRDVRIQGRAADPTPASADWTAIPTAPTTVAYNGQKSYTLTWNGVDYTDRINPGTRLRTTRTVAAPTQCTSLNGTTQYWTKTSPNKMTFTDDFTPFGRVKMFAYGGTQTIISRFSASGWSLQVTPSGQVEVYADNGTVSRAYLTYQSIPLNKWVDVYATLDMSGGVGAVYLDGISVPVVSSGGAGTILAQAGNLNVGARNGVNFFNGVIAQAGVFNAILSAATIKSYSSQGLLGTETSLASAYSFNGVATDLNTTTPNDLTAVASAGYTADSPFGTQASGLISATLDYAKVVSSTFSTNTTVVVRTPEGNTIPTSGGVSAISYSGMEAPYGFPLDGNSKILGYTQLCAGFTSGASGTVTEVLGLATTVTTSPGQRIKLKTYSASASSTTIDAVTVITIWDGAVGAGTQIAQANINNAVAKNQFVNCEMYMNPTTVAHTYRVGILSTAGTNSYAATTIAPAYLSIEVV